MEKLRSRFRLAPTYTLLCLAAAVLAPACSGGGATTNECMSPTTRCDSGCVDLSTDASNCGQCGNGCATGETCSEGACVAGCEDGQTACGEECVDTGTSEAHCGRCDNACDEGQTCADGACEDASCEEGSERCDGACVDVQTDAAHCGECGNACGADQACVSGACEEGGCGSGLTACGDACVDVQTDAANCGACGSECSSLALCQTGMCACTVSPGQDLGSVVPQVVNNTTVGAASTFAPSCVATSSSERVYAFTAPSAGVYNFDTSASAFNTVVALLDAAGCTEIACNADPGAARISRDLAADQTVYVVVDGVDGETGAFQLSVTRESAPTCPAGELTGTTPQTITGSTSGRPDSVTPTEGEGCPPSEGRDAGYAFTAPLAGDYVFDTYGSTFDTVLHVHEATCQGAQLACNDDDTVRFTEQSEVTVTLAANQTVVVVVDGVRPEASGEFTLRVRSAVPAPTCDNSGFCGDGTSGCMQCALNGSCRDENEACALNDDCVIATDCYVTCPEDSDTCKDECRRDHPTGAALYDAILVCAHCNECANDCSGANEVVCP